MLMNAPRYRWMGLLSLGLLMWQCGPNPTGSLEESHPERVPDYITAERYTRLVIEVDYVEGMKPEGATLQNLVAGLEPLLAKPDGIEVVLDEKLAARGADYRWSGEELLSLQARTFDLPVDDRTVKMHALFLDGRDARDDSYLGLEWANRNIAIFKQSIDRSCRTQTKHQFGLVERLCQQAEESIWTHEIGHVIGLVDNGLPMVTDHVDPDHPHHDADEACVMYWAFERQKALDSIRGRLRDDPDSDALGFGEACRADIAAMQSP